MSYILTNAVRRAADNGFFTIPHPEQSQSLNPGDMAKMLFNQAKGVWADEMWVHVVEVRHPGPLYFGTLASRPLTKLFDLKCGEVVTFRPENVIAIDRQGARAENEERLRVVCSTCPELPTNEECLEDPHRSNSRIAEVERAQPKTNKEG